jgi:GT2 family glycosyltransferase
VGFAGANNQGFQSARGVYVATLNNDTAVEPQWLAALVSTMETDPRVGMVASKMLYVDQPQVINSTGICVDRSGVVWDRLTGREEAEADATPVEVFGPCAGAALYRRAMLDDVGVFDAAYFIYLEDVDLAWRARWQGWKALYAPQARVYHMHSATMQEGSPRKTLLLARNKVTTLVRHYPSPYWIIYSPLIMVYEFLSIAFSIYNRRGMSALRGRWAGVCAVPGIWRVRQARARKPHVSAREVFAHLEPAAWPWQVYSRYRHLRRAAKKPCWGEEHVAT